MPKNAPKCLTKIHLPITFTTLSKSFLSSADQETTLAVTERPPAVEGGAEKIEYETLVREALESGLTIVDVTDVWLKIPYREDLKPDIETEINIGSEALTAKLEESVRLWREKDGRNATKTIDGKSVESTINFKVQKFRSEGESGEWVSTTIEVLTSLDDKTSKRRAHQVTIKRPNGVRISFDGSQKGPYSASSGHICIDESTTRGHQLTDEFWKKLGVEKLVERLQSLRKKCQQMEQNRNEMVEDRRRKKREEELNRVREEIEALIPSFE